MMQESGEIMADNNSIKKELEGRIRALRDTLVAYDADFDTALIVGRVNQYYLTGTMQDSLLVLKKDGSAYLFVKKSFERAKEECPLDIVYKMSSYRDIAEIISPDLGNTYLETDLIPVAMLERLRKYFKMDIIKPIERIILNQRSLKSEQELSIMIHSGEQHRRLLEEIVPALLAEGMSEAQLHGELFNAMMKLRYHGISRFSMFQFEAVAGQIGFGENSVYPTNFDGPGGMRGMSAASPAVGSRERFLKKGDLVFADVGYGEDGYHTDKTQVYSFGAPPDGEIIKIHRACMDVEQRCAELLVPGATPSVIYASIMGNLPEILTHGGFMGYGESVSFLGHGIGLHINEIPVIAKGFDEPLAENMVIALEPKYGIPGVGTVGVEDTYIVRSGYSECVTGGGKDIIVV